MRTLMIMDVFGCYYRCAKSPQFLAALIGGAFLLLLSGCSSEVGRFFEKDHIEIHSKDLIRQVSTVEPVPEINNPLPEIYRQPPKIITNSKGTKLFYFTKHHTPQILNTMVSQQLGYNSSMNAATNQMVIPCKSEDEARVALEFLEQVDVPPIQVQVDCLVSELFADITLDYETTLDIQDLLQINSVPTRKVADLISDVITMGSENSILNTSATNPNFPGAAARTLARRQIGLKVGLSAADDSFRAVIDMLISRGYLKVLMNPRLRVVNGQKATIEAKDDISIENTVFLNATTTKTETVFKPVVDSLEITPTAYADGSVGLKTNVQISSRSTATGPIQDLIFTERKITVAENRIEPGKSMVIGGIRKSEQLGIVRGVPLLKDIPVLGILFSGKDEEALAKEIIFIITPSIADTGRDHEEVIEEIRKKHQRPETKRGILKTMTDPLGQEVYTEHVEKKAIESETERIRTEMQIAEAKEELIMAEKSIEEKTAALEAANAELARLQAEAQKAQATAAAAQQQAAATKAESDKTRAEAAKIKAEAEKAKADAQAAQEAAKQAEAAKAKAEAEKAAAEAQAAAARAAAEKEAAERAKAEAEKARLEAEKARLEAEKAQMETEKNQAPEPNKPTAANPPAEQPAPAPEQPPTDPPTQ